MSNNLRNKKDIVKKYGKNEQDTGSTEVTEHLKANKKDFGGKRGLLMMVGHRKSLLSYLKDKDLQGYRDLVKKLNLRG